MSMGSAMAEPLLNVSGKSIILLVILLNISATAAPNEVEGGSDDGDTG